MLTIIGCGNLNRCDDGVGVIIAQRLQSYLQQYPCGNVQVLECGTGGMEVMFQARGSSQLIVVDASFTGSPPGAIFEVPGDELIALPEPSYNLHDFRWDNAIAVGKKIFRDDFPEDVLVYLIEAENLDFGWELSAKVQIAAESVVEKLKALIANYNHGEER